MQHRVLPTQVEGAPTRTIEGGELVNPVADAQKAAAFTEQITAAQADPSAKGYCTRSACYIDDFL